MRRAEQRLPGRRRLVAGRHSRRFAELWRLRPRLRARQWLLGGPVRELPELPHRCRAGLRRSDSRLRRRRCGDRFRPGARRLRRRWPSRHPDRPGHQLSRRQWQPDLLELGVLDHERQRRWLWWHTPAHRRLRRPAGSWRFQRRLCARHRRRRRHHAQRRARQLPGPQQHRGRHRRRAAGERRQPGRQARSDRGLGEPRACRLVQRRPWSVHARRFLHIAACALPSRERRLQR